MNWRNVLIPLGLLALVIPAWRAYGMQGLLVLGGGLLMWALLHFTRLMNVMQKAAKNPISHVASAVMLNARLKPGVNLMHVVAMTRSLGQALSQPGSEPEIYLWCDAGGSQVRCEFMQGRLVRWQLQRPQPAP